MKTVPVPLRHIEGQFLLRYANLGRWPEKIGKVAFDVGARSVFDDQMVSLRRALRLVSPIIATKKKFCFGELANWTVTGEKDEEVYTMVDPDKETTVVFDEDAIEGVKAALRLMTDPASPAAASMEELDTLVWQVASKIGHYAGLRHDLGLQERPDPFTNKG